MRTPLLATAAAAALLGVAVSAWYYSAGGDASSQAVLDEAPVPVQGELINSGKRAAPILAAPVPTAAAQPSPAQPPAATPAPAGASSAPGAVVPLGFQTLGSFKYDVPLPFDAAKSAATPPPKTGQIPPEIKALDGRTVAIQGFMVPTVFESDGVKSFILAKDQQLCCYGVMPKMNEWVDVRMAEGHKADFFPDRPVTVTGKMEVGEQFDDTIVLSIYRIEATRVSQ